MTAPKEQFCEYCGEPMGFFKWSRSIDGPLSCGATGCSRMGDEHAAREEEARYAAEQDGYSRYGGGWVILFALMSLFASYASAQTLTGTARVIDGDTLEVAGQKVRLHGVDAPELSQTCTRASAPYHCGMVSLVRLEEMINGRPVTCRALDKDRYGRTIARCFVDLSVGTAGRPQAHMDLGGWMVRQGYAVAYTRYSRDYLPQESVARGAKLGLWSGSFVAPAEWRKGVR